jgi:hypothetical protein
VREAVKRVATERAERTKREESARSSEAVWTCNGLVPVT